VYISVGLIYSHFVENYDLIDSCYFVANTVLLIGYGGLAFTHKPMNMLFACGYILIGLFVTALCTGTVLKASVDKTNRDIQRRIASMLIASGKHASPFMLAWEALRFRLVYLLLGYAFLIGLGTVMISELEKLTVIEAFYFVVVSVSTLGFGDYECETKAGKAFASVYLPIGVFATAAVFSSLASIPFLIKQAEEEHSVLEEYGLALTVSSFDILEKSHELEKLGIQSHHGRVTRNEFILWLLVKLGKADIADIKHCGQAFDLMDTDGDGVIDFAKVELIKKRAVESPTYRRVRRLVSTMEVGTQERKRRQSSSLSSSLLPE
jgi:potassium channel subfamily K, other eukaryote